MYFNTEVYLGTDGRAAALKESARMEETTAVSVLDSRDIVLFCFQGTSFNVFDINRAEIPISENLYILEERENKKKIG